MVICQLRHHDAPPSRLAASMIRPAQATGREGVAREDRQREAASSVSPSLSLRIARPRRRRLSSDPESARTTLHAGTPSHRPSPTARAGGHHHADARWRAVARCSVASVHFARSWAAAASGRPSPAPFGRGHDVAVIDSGRSRVPASGTSSTGRPSPASASTDAPSSRPASRRPTPSRPSAAATTPTSSARGRARDLGVEHVVARIYDPQRHGLPAPRHPDRGGRCAGRLTR